MKDLSKLPPLLRAREEARAAESRAFAAYAAIPAHDTRAREKALGVWEAACAVTQKAKDAYNASRQPAPSSGTVPA